MTPGGLVAAEKTIVGFELIQFFAGVDKLCDRTPGKKNVFPIGDDAKLISACVGGMDARGEKVNITRIDVLDFPI